MRPYFLDTVGDWVEMQYNIQNYLEKVGKVFGEDFMLLSRRLTSAYQKCFADFLMFEYKPIFFYYKTGLEYFVEYNPQNLDKEMMDEYKEILETNMAGVFEIKRLAEKQGMELFIPELGNIFVHDEHLYKGYEVGMLVWARVAKVKNKYYFVNDFVTPVSASNGVAKEKVLGPLSVQGMCLVIFADKEMISKQVRENNKMLDNFAKQSLEEFEKLQDEILKTVKNIKQDFEKEVVDPEKPLREATKIFEDLRKKLGIDHLFTLETFNKWIEKPGEKNLDFALRSLVFFVPEDFLEKHDVHEVYIQAGQTYINAYLTVKKVKKTLEEMENIKSIDDFKDFRKKQKLDIDKFDAERGSNEGDRDDEGRFVMKAYTWSDFQELQFAGHKYLKENKLKESKESYLKLVEKLVKEEILFWPAFRVFANAASTHFMLGEFFMAVALADASLRLNPQYEFAKMMKKNFLEAAGSKKVPGEVTKMFYDGSVFQEYEKFLNEHDVNLNHKVTAKVKMYEVKK